MITESVGIALLTLLVGPVTFYLLSYDTALRNTTHKRYPTGIIDSFGDIIFLPLFNALAVYFGVLNIPFGVLQGILALLVGTVITAFFVVWRKNIARYNDWTRPEKGMFNKAGWYHAGYMFVQATFLSYALLMMYETWWLWLAFGGYLLLVVIRYVELIFFKKTFAKGNEYR